MKRRSRTVETAVLIASLLWLSLVPSAFAYHVFGGHFGTANLKYYYDTAMSAIDHTAYAAARASWSQQPTPICICIQVYDNTWQVGFFPINNNSVAYDGITTTLPSNTYVPTLFSYAEINDFYTNGYSAGERQSVAEHEVGHSLGLAHTSGAVLMNPGTCGPNSRWCTYGIKTPQADDVFGINYLY